MKRGPAPGARAGATTAVEKARAAWGEAIRPEVLALAEACDRASQSAVARQLGYSSGLISYVLWGELDRAGALHNGSRGALHSFVSRQTGVASPEWLTASQANQVTEGLKAMLRRHRERAI